MTGHSQDGLIEGNNLLAEIVEDFYEKLTYLHLD